MKNRTIEWECPHCKEKLKSYSGEHHKMDTCKCGKSFIDIGHDYFNSGGFLKVIIEK